jgi:hypothetical protein
MAQSLVYIDTVLRGKGTYEKEIVSDASFGCVSHADFGIDENSDLANSRLSLQYNIHVCTSSEMLASVDQSSDLISATLLTTLDQATS